MFLKAQAQADDRFRAAGHIDGGVTALMLMQNPRHMGGVLDGKPVFDVACGLAFATCCTIDGRVYTWGDNSCGQLGVGDTEPRASPTIVPDLLTPCVVNVSCGAYHR